MNSNTHTHTHTHIHTHTPAAGNKDLAVDFVRRFALQLTPREVGIVRRSHKKMGKGLVHILMQGATARDHKVILFRHQKPCKNGYPGDKCIMSKGKNKRQKRVRTKGGQKKGDVREKRGETSINRKKAALLKRLRAASSLLGSRRRMRSTQD